MLLCKYTLFLDMRVRKLVVCVVQIKKSSLLLTIAITTVMLYNYASMSINCDFLIFVKNLHLKLS